MEFLQDDGEVTRIEELYAVARQYGSEWVGFLDLCFDGGDSIDEAGELLASRLADSCPAEVFFDTEI